MTTSEIAAAVQSGHMDVLALWAAVNRFTYGQAKRWKQVLGARCGATLEDFMQDGFLALLDALEGWEPDAGEFITWYALRLKGAFTEATGQRTQREKRDPLHDYLSLDVPLSDDMETVTLGDAIPDPAAEAAIESVAERDRLGRLHHVLTVALQGLPENQRAALVGEYWYGQKADPKAKAAALRALRHPSISRELRAYY